MTPDLTLEVKKNVDKTRLKVLIDDLYLPNIHLYTTEAYEVENEIKEKIKGLQAWATKLINEKL